MAKSTTGTKEFKGRKATFRVKLDHGKRVFTAVNKRAKHVAHKAGKRTKLTLDDLKALNGSGSYRYYAYQEDGSIKPIRF